MKGFCSLIIMSLLTIFATTHCSDVAPDNTVITIDPDRVDYDDQVDDYFNETFLITVKNRQGEPLNDVEITIEFVWAPDYSCPTPGCTPALIMFDKDGNQVSSPFTTRTRDDGTYPVILRLNAKGYSYKADLKVWSGTNFASSEISMNQ
jgi:hypothetical protein